MPSRIEIGDYTLVRQLARGGMADLYLAHSAAHPLAVVKLVAARFAKDQRFVSMFENELRITALLDHDNIGRVYDVGESGGHYYLAMEFLHGQDLRSIIRRSIKHYRQAVPIAIVVQIARHVCAALSHAHTLKGPDGSLMNLIHRDVSPSNVMVTYDGQVKLIDFGIAKIATRAIQTNPALAKGKARYRSPEQLLGLALDLRADIFTLGVLMWEATVGRYLFPGSNDDEICTAIRSGHIREPETVVSDYPQDFSEILMKALAYDRDRRYGSAGALERALGEYARRNGHNRSTEHLAEYVQALFEEPFREWDSARRGGQSLVEHLIGEEVSKSTMDNEEREKPAADGPRRTMFYGQVTRGSQELKASKTSPGVGNRATDQPAQGQSTDAPKKVVGLSSAGGVIELNGQGSQAEADRRPTILADAGAKPGTEGSDEKVVAEGARTIYDPKLAKPLEAPTTSGKSREVPPQLVGQGHERARKRTGDWSHQRTAEGESRPRTHPYFKGESIPPPSAGPLTETHTLVRKRRPVVAISFAVLVLLGLVAALFWPKSKENTTETPSVPTQESHQARQERTEPSGPDTVRLLSDPPGATVFSRVDGLPLGKTPLDLTLTAEQSLRIDIRLKGYLPQQVTLTGREKVQTFKLKKRGNDLWTPTRNRSNPARTKANQGEKVQDLVDPFAE